MTEKKEKILESALKLFAEQGYKSTPTSKIAADAKVSEALIFRHFGNKEGLLEAVLKEGESKIKVMYAEVIMESNPKKLLRRALEMPFEVPETEFDFWRLQFKLKWELGDQSNEKMKPLEVALKNAFEELKYPEPAMEAEYILHFLDGLSGAVLRGVSIDKARMKKFILRKYKLE